MAESIRLTTTKKNNTVT